MNRGTLNDEAGYAPRHAPAALITLHSLRLDHQVVDGNTARAVLLAASAQPLLEWVPPANSSAVTACVSDARGGVVWKSEVPSGTTGVRVGIPLEAFSSYRWTLEVEGGELLQVQFETGPLTFRDWTSRWLEVPAGATLSVPFLTSLPVSARLYFTGQGLVRASLNDVPVNAGRLDPSRTDISRALYRGFDVTDLLQDGENNLEFVLGSGEWHRTGLEPRLLAELVLTETDGRRRIIVPSASSGLITSEIVEDEPFYLERHDPLAAGVSIVGSKLRELVSSETPPHADVPPETVLPDTGPPVRSIDVVTANEVRRGDGWRTFDVGTNIAGRVRLEVEGVVAASVIGVLHGEHVTATGRVDTTNLTMPYDNGRERQLVEFVVRTSDPQTLQAWFAYEGFRYVEVRGLDEEAQVRVVAETLHSDLQSRSDLRTDAAIVEELLKRGRRTALNNLHSVPEDCPTREQAGWTGDAASASDFLFYAFDMAAFVEKWLGDIVTSQQSDGSLPAVAPDPRVDRVPPDPSWGSALHRMLRAHWLHVGDEQVLRRTLPALRSWANYQLARVDDLGIVSKFDMSYGHDWLALEQTPPPLIHTGAVLDCLESLAFLESEVGDKSAAEIWVSRANEIRAAARRVFVDADNLTVANGSQGSVAVALDAGLFTNDEIPHVVEDLEKRIRKSGIGLTTGFALTRTLVDALARQGQSQLVFDLLSKTRQPGIGSMLVDGPGTFWENWWIDPKNTGTGSLDHVGLGAPFAGWAWRHLAGVRPTGPAWSSFLVDPSFVVGVDHLTLTQDTPHGPVGVNWQRNSGTITITIEVPSGSEATLLFTGQENEAEVVGAGRHVRVIQPVEEGARPPVDSSEWTAPAIAPISTDVSGPVDLLHSGQILAGEETTVEWLDQLICMPIPHAQTGKPVVVARATTTAGSPTILVKLVEPLDLASVTFVYALLDLCLDGGGWTTHQQLTLILEDGSRHSATARTWPAGYNRVTVDTTGIPVAHHLVAIEIGLAAVQASIDTSLGVISTAAPAAFHLGEVGTSTRRRTW